MIFSIHDGGEFPLSCSKTANNYCWQKKRNISWQGPVFRIAITGGLGSGKTTFRKKFAKYGCTTLSADRLGHQILKQTNIRERLIHLWGKEILTADQQQIDRKKIANRVFTDSKALAILNNLLHPLIHQSYLETLNRLPPATILVYEIPLLYESYGKTNNSRQKKISQKIWNDFDLVIVITATKNIRKKRMLKKTNWSEKEFEQREKNQLPLRIKEKNADLVIFNDEDHHTIDNLIQSLIKKIILGNPKNYKPIDFLLYVASIMNFQYYLDSLLLLATIK